VGQYYSGGDIPPPSLLVYSGKGMHAKWLLKTCLPRGALPRWNACQRYLGVRLKLLGADSNARDASRVLRLISTVNSKSGEICRLVHVESCLDGQPIRYDFEKLAELLLPRSRQEARERQKTYKSHGQSKRRQDRTRIGVFCGRQLAWDRLNDLRKLASMRGGVGEGQRMKFLFWCINFLLLSGVTSSFDMYREARTLVQELAPGWRDYRSQELMTLYAKAKQHEAGKKIDFNGKKYSPLYTPTTQKLIDIFEITAKEQHMLKTIISAEVKGGRRALKTKDQRRASGVLSREAYLVEPKAKRLKALELRSQGMSIRLIAEVLNRVLPRFHGRL